MAGTRETRRRPTLADVARIAGVDTSLVSRVLRNDPRGFASKETRERILRSAEEIGYRANAAARGLRNAPRATWTNSIRTTHVRSHSRSPTSHEPRS